MVLAFKKKKPYTVNKCNRIEIPEVRPNIHSPLMTDKSTSNQHWRKDFFFSVSDSREFGYPEAREQNYAPMRKKY